MAALIAAALLWAYWGGLESYLGDQHYQEHFAYLWCFAALTLWHSLRGPFRGVFSLGKKRDLVAVGLALTASLTLLVAQVTGSSTAARSSLVMVLTGLSLAVVPSWSVSRCLMHGALLQLCFGIPYSFYFPLTNKLRWGVSQLIGLPAELGLVSYEMAGPVIRFPHYDLEITSDCSGIGQLLTFTGIAALGILSSNSSAKRTVTVLLLAVVMAWMSNFVRVGVFVMCVGWGWTSTVDNPTLHSAVGFAVFLPFVVTLVWILIKTHRPLSEQGVVEAPAGRFPVLLLIAPVLLVRLLATPSVPELEEPRYFQQLSSPPGHQLVMNSKSAESDRKTYDTQWLISARFARSGNEWFDLFYYHTRSPNHLCVHQVSDCLGKVGQTIRYGEPFTVGGHRWWPIALDARDPADSWHVYFAFEVDGERRDDSLATQAATLMARALRGEWDVQLTRVMFPGPLPDAVSDYESEILSWITDTVYSE